jgi:hypothetical protein
VEDVQFFVKKNELGRMAPENKKRVLGAGLGVLFAICWELTRVSDKPPGDLEKLPYLNGRLFGENPGDLAT